MIKVIHISIYLISLLLSFLFQENVLSYDQYYGPSAPEYTQLYFTLEQKIITNRELGYELFNIPNSNCFKYRYLDRNIINLRVAAGAMKKYKKNFFKNIKVEMKMSIMVKYYNGYEELVNFKDNNNKIQSETPLCVERDIVTIYGDVNREEDNEDKSLEIMDINLGEAKKIGIKSFEFSLTISKKMNFLDLVSIKDRLGKSSTYIMLKDANSSGKLDLMDISKHDKRLLNDNTLKTYKIIFDKGESCYKFIIL